MRITILTVGKIKERYLRDGIAEFTKRLGPFCRLEVKELDEERMPDEPSAAQKEQALSREGERLLKQIPPASRVFVLDVAGKQQSSEELAATFASCASNGDSHLTFIIGGAFGFSDDVRKAAHVRLSFSKMTFTHQMIRLLLVEQIYRAFKIWRGEKYHW